MHLEVVPRPVCRLRRVRQHSTTFSPFVPESPSSRRLSCDRAYVVQGSCQPIAANQQYPDRSPCEYQQARYPPVPVVGLLGISADPTASVVSTPASLSPPSNSFACSTNLSCSLASPSASILIILFNSSLLFSHAAFNSGCVASTLAITSANALAFSSFVFSPSSLGAVFNSGCISNPLRSGFNLGLPGPLDNEISKSV